MRRQTLGLFSGRLTEWLVAGLVVSLAVLVWFGHRAILEWRRSEELLADRRARDTADLLVTALSRDMRGVQNAVLSEWWEEVTIDSPDDVRKSVASAFARYPYPESFFVWRRGTPDDEAAFFHRSDRLPAWSTPDPAATPYPVVRGREPRVGRAVVDRVRADGRVGRRFSVFEMPIGEARYQIVARLFHADPYRQSVDGIVGFTVNLQWVRRHYFPDVAQQVGRIGGGLPVAIADAGGRTVAGVAGAGTRGPVVRRWFPVLFIDPLLVGIDSPADLSCEFWAVHVRVDDDRVLSGAVAGARRTMVLTAAAAVSLLVGLILTVRASRARARLSALRSEFVSTVTHELKTPVTALKILGETLVRSKVADASPFHEYPRAVVRESRRLMRLIENLLAYSRVTDLADLYQFEPLDVGDLVRRVAQAFRTQVTEAGFQIDIDVPPDLPHVRGDRSGLTLVVDNLLDNALRYSGESRTVCIRAERAAGRTVSLEVVDHGIGIPQDEIPQVTGRFFRGRHAGSAGSGLGLAIVRRIVADHRGTLAIVSHPGAGTTVRIGLPVAE